jgi:hypothetical protein
VDGSAVTLAGQIQCRDTTRWGVQREFNRRILDRFRELGIEIANPQRHLLTWDPESVPARIDETEAPNGALKDDASRTPVSADAAHNSDAHDGDAPVEDQIPVDPKPAVDSGTPSPHK